MTARVANVWSRRDGTWTTQTAPDFQAGGTHVAASVHKTGNGTWEWDVETRGAVPRLLGYDTTPTLSKALTAATLAVERESVFLLSGMAA